MERLRCYCHCISRCVRRARLCGQGFEHRQQWIKARLETLSGCFALSACGFAVMDNHLHVLVRLDANDTQSWSAEGVMQRWVVACPPKTPLGQPIEITQEWTEHQAQDGPRVALLRERLANLGWFMTALNEPLSRMANRANQRLPPERSRDPPARQFQKYLSL